MAIALPISGEVERRARKAALYCLLVLSSFSALAADLDGASRQPVEWRSHSTVDDAHGNVLYVLTDIHRVRDAGGATVLLVYDKSTGQQFVMTRHYDIENHRSLMQVADVAGKKYFRQWYPLPSAAKTREELTAELESNPRLFDVADPVVTLETTAASHTARASELTRIDPHARWVSELRESLDPSFLEGLERMRASLFGTAVGATFYSTLTSYLFHGGCAPAADDAHVMAEFPDCGFDKSFGFDCSDLQKERIAKAREEKRALAHY
jgi:hypothetical protein